VSPFSLAAALTLAAATHGFTAQAQAARMIDSSLAHLGSADWSTVATGETLREVCSLPVAPAALAITVGPPSRHEAAHCLAAGRRIAFTARIGYEAAYLVSQLALGPGLDQRDLYRATAAMVPSEDDSAIVPNRARHWRDVRSDLPDTPISVLLPPPGQPPHPVFARSILEPGCLGAAVTRAIFDVQERVRLCTDLRTDGPVTLAAPGTDPFAWLSAQGSMAVAVVGQADIARLGDEQAVLPLAEVMPTYSAVSAGAYPASSAIYVTLVAPAADGSLPAAAREVVAESVIGPDGNMVLAGMTPLPPAERVALRARLATLEGW
jgi:phosphate transport system substrate-binding protein